MAQFDTEVRPTGDPSYTGNQYTQGTDRAALQSLPTVPQLSTKVVTPDYKADTSAGKAIGDFGSLFDTAVKATDTAIQNKLDDTLQKGIQGIRDSYLTAQAQAINQADGHDVAGGLTLNPNKSEVPVAVDRLGQKIQNLQEAYRQGVFDDTAYYGKLEAYVRQVKAQYPGYTEDVDKKVQKITGVTPANALRSAQLQKLDELNKQSTAAQNKWDTYEKQNQAYIQTIWPNYFVDKANGKAPDPITVQNQVGKLQANELLMKTKTSELALTKGVNEKNTNTAMTLATQGVTDISSHLVLGATNAMGLRTPQDFQKLMDDVRTGKRPPLTPDEKTQIADSLGQLKSQYLVKAEQFLTAPLAEGSVETLTSKINDGPTRERIINQGRAMLDNLEDALFNEKYGLVAHDMNWNKATVEAATGTFLKTAPASGTVAAARNLIGDNGTLMLNLYNGPLADNLMQGFRQYGAAVAATGTGSMTQTFDIFRKEGQMSPELWSKHINDSVNIIVQQKQLADGPTAAKNAAKYLFGPENNLLMESYRARPGSQVNVFNNLVSKPVVDAINKMDPESKQMFLSWAESGFASVYQTQAAGANQNAKAWEASQNLKLTYDEKSGNFSYQPTNMARGFFTPASTIQKANAGLAPLNSAINNMKEVFKMQGKTVSEGLYHLLPIAGIEPGSPLYNSVSKVIEDQEAERVKQANQ